MEHRLANVEQEKRDRIINSAMKEFSTHTFQKASTNAIVEEAGISKGLLFHYFGNKEKLYNYLEGFSFEVIATSILEKMDWDNEDIFIRLKEVTMIKLETFQRYPYLADFSLLLFKDKSVEDIMQGHPNFPLQLYAEVYTKNINYGLFKDHLEVEKAVNIIRWTIEKYSDELRRKIEQGIMEFEQSEIEKEIFSYIDILRESFYK